MTSLSSPYFPRLRRPTTEPVTVALSHAPADVKAIRARHARDTDRARRATSVGPPPRRGRR